MGGWTTRAEPVTWTGSPRLHGSPPPAARRADGGHVGGLGRIMGREGVELGVQVHRGDLLVLVLHVVSSAPVDDTTVPTGR